MTQEPIAYINVEKRTLEFAKNIFWHTPTVANIDRIPLFTQRTWVGLTDEDMKGMSYGDKVLATWVARTLKEKNT